MLFWLVDPISIMSFCRINPTNFFIFRSIGSLLTALFISLAIGKFFINWLCNVQFFQIIRSDGPEKHQLKHGTPTMGGVIILVALILSIIIWIDLSYKYIWHVLFILLAYGMLGGVDDWLKIKRKNSIGLSVLRKYFWQSFIAFLLIIFIFVTRSNDLDHTIYNWQFFKSILLQLDIWSMLLAYFIIVGSSNAVNLSDGLDGLVIVPIVLIVIGFILVVCIMSNAYVSNYFHIMYIESVKELIIICSVIVGAGLGFLWFNGYPAQVFMGDTGSLSLGGLVGLIAVLLHQECVLLIMGGVFLIELLSVVVQVIYFKMFKKRIFSMAPIHHHFELRGYVEPKIIIRFWIISSVLMLCGFVYFIF